MPIITAELKTYLSGGAANSDVNASLGGIISTTEVVDATLHNLFDQVSSAETSAGDTEYRCVYLANTNGTITLQNAVAFINTQTPSADTSFEIALGTSAINGTEQTVADESTAPAGVTWTALVGEGNALAIGDIPAGQHKALWVKRIVNVGSSAYNNDSAIIEFKGDTAA